MSIPRRLPAAVLLAGTAVTLAAVPAASATPDDGGRVDGVAVTYIPDGLHKSGHDRYVDNDVVGSITRNYAGGGATASVTVYRSDAGRSLANLKGWVHDDMPAPKRTTVHGKPAYEGEQNGKNNGIIWVERPGVGVNVQTSKDLGEGELRKIAEGTRPE